MKLTLPRALFRPTALSLGLALLAPAQVGQAATTFTLNYGTGIPDGMRLCDAQFNPNYCLDITMDAATTPTTLNYAVYGADPQLWGEQVWSDAFRDDVVVWNYSTLNSPTPFTLDSMNIANILSLTAGQPSAGEVRDGYAWADTGTWTINGTGGDFSPAGAVVSVDRTNSFGGIGNYVGNFVVSDPDTFPCDPSNNINNIKQFNALVALEPVSSSDVLLNMCGQIDGHDVSYSFDVPVTETKLYVFNAGSGGMVWAFKPSTTVTLQDPKITLQSVVDNGAGGSASASDFVLSFDNGAGTAASGISGAAAITDVDVTAGTYTLSSSPYLDYVTTLSCQGVLDPDPSDGLSLGDGSGALCTFTHTYTPPPTSPYGPGSGLASSICDVASPTGNVWADIAMRWDHNSGPGGSIDQTDVFDSIGAYGASGLTATINFNDINIDRSTIPASFDPSRYISYSFTTKNFANTVEIYGIGIAGYDATQPSHNQASGQYRFVVQIDDDAGFGTPVTLMSDTQMDNGNLPGSIPGKFVDDFGSAIYNFGHYDASGEVVSLSPSTTYHVRVFPFYSFAAGKDDAQPYTEVVLWDDFMLKAVSCTPIVPEANDDSFSISSVGGTAGDAFDNDTVNGVAVTAADVDTNVLTPATPLSVGADVPFLETSGPQEGQVTVPAGTPIGVYTISYEICEAGDATNCDPATITVTVTDPPTADLSLDKVAQLTVDGSPVSEAQAGTGIDFVLTLSNAGPGTATAVQVRDLLPSGFTYVSDTAGGAYDPVTGNWDVTNLASGASAMLTISAVMQADGIHLNRAEIIASAQDDPDSDPNVGHATDDLSDGLADDDEASASVTLITGGQVLSGTVFKDNGAGGASAHDGILGGSEEGGAYATLAFYDDGASLIGETVVAADGRWSFAVPLGFTGAVTVTVTPDSGSVLVSETAQALPGLVNADPRDGSLTFTPALATDYAGIDFGVIQRATLTQSQEATIAAGQVVTLAHDYRADSAGQVTFSLAEVTQSPPDGFSATLFADADCDGTPEAVLSGAQSIAADTRLCVVVRVSANGGIGQGSVFAYDLIATTTYSGITYSETNTNTDRLTGAGAEGRLELTKTVANLTQGTGEGNSNAGAVGDVLEYRIILRNPSQAFASNVVIYDQTPAYTRLAAAVPSPVSVGAGLVCTVAAPATNNAGYAGELRWDCAGNYAPGETGSVTFRVEIAP